MTARHACTGRLAWLLTLALACPAPARQSPQPPAPTALSLDDAVRLGLERNPSLRQAGFDVDAARARALQAGLYPNPTVGVLGEEIGRRGGIYTLPQVSQELVTADKLGLGRAVADRQADQAVLALERQRLALLTSVRQAYFEALAAQRRVEALGELVRLADEALTNAERLRQVQRLAELDVLQFRVERDRLRADLDAAERELPAARRRLAAAVGVADLPPAPLAGSLEGPLPDYDFDRARALVVAGHPEARSADVGVARAQIALRREEAEVVPNVTVSGGYQRNANERENEGRFEVSVPVPLWNRNQGNVRAAQAEVGRAVAEAERVRLDLAGRLATAYGRYAAARGRAERYRGDVLPAARRGYALSLEAFQGGQFEYLRVIQAQRAVREAYLEYLRSLAEAWGAAAEVAGLASEPDCWPAQAALPPP